MFQSRRHLSVPSVIRIALLLIISAVIVVGCRKSEPPASTSGVEALLLYAFSAEGEALRDRIESPEADTVLGREALKGILAGRHVVVCGSGMGLTNAAMMTQSLIDRYRPAAVVFTGIAGALDTSVAIGDLVVCSTWATHDYVHWGRDSVVPVAIRSFSSAEDSIRAFTSFDVDMKLLQAARRVAADTLRLVAVADRRPRVFVGGVGVSGNAFIDSRDKRQWLNTRFAASITDMESAAVVQVCHANNLPCLVVRSASDLAGGSDIETAGQQLERFFKVAASNSAGFVVALLAELPR